MFKDKPLWIRFLVAVAMAPGLAALLLWLYVACVAMRRGGKVTLDFNKYREGKLEIATLAASVLAWIVAFSWLIQRLAA